MKAVNGKEQGKRRDRLFSSTERVHVAEALHGRHGVELEATLVRFVRVGETQIRVSAQRVLATLGHVRVDGLESAFNVVVGFQKALGTLGLDFLKGLGCFGGSILSLVVICLAVLQTLRCG